MLKDAWAIPLKNKNGKTVTEAFKKCFNNNRTCEKLQVDKGSEFYNKDFLVFCKSKKITIYSTQSELKACVVERKCIDISRIQTITSTLTF